VYALLPSMENRSRKSSTGFHLRVVLLLALALLLGLEPVIHHHPLIPSGALSTPGASSTLCTACVAGSDRIALSATATFAPLVVVFTLVFLSPATQLDRPATAASSRAPPAL
jgi:hypothetical protein